MTWSIEYQEAFDAWDITTDPVDDTLLRIAVLEVMQIDWRTYGPPDDDEADYDPLRDTWTWDIPGTPIRVEYRPVHSQNAVIVRRFY